MPTSRRGDSLTSSAPPAQPRAGQLRARLAGLLRDEVRRSALVSLTLTGLGAALSFSMLLVLAWAMGKEEFGRFALLFSIVSFGSVVAGRGGEMFILRSWSEYLHQSRPDLARAALMFGLKRAVVGALAVAAVIVAVGLASGLPLALLLGLAAFTLAQTLSLYSSQVARAVVGVAAGVVHRELTWRALVIAAAGAALLSGRGFSSEGFFLVAVTGIALAALIQITSVLRRLPDGFWNGPPAPPLPDWPQRCRRMWIGVIVEASGQHLDTVIVGLVLSPTDAGVYFLAMRLASVFLMVGDALMLYTSKMIPELYYRGEHGDVARLLARTSALAAALVAMGLAIVALGGDQVLSVFGAAFAQHQPILLILCLGTAATTLGGPAPSLLTLTGHEGPYAAAVAAGLAGRFLLFAALAWSAGLWGAALGTTIGLIGLALALNAMSRRRVGIDPSILSLLRPMQRAAR